MIANAIIVVLSFVIVLSVVVFIHEMGHYSVAKLFNTKIERFSVGFGKPFARWTTKSGEEWVIGRLPLGGYVKFAGDQSAASNPDFAELERLRTEMGEESKALFQFKPVWQRILIVLAGPVANFILSIVIFAALAFSLGQRAYAPVIGAVNEGSPAEQAGLAPGDLITALDGRPIETFSEVQNYVTLRGGELIVMDVSRAGRTVTLNATPEPVIRRDVVGGMSRQGTLGFNVDTTADRIVKRFGPLESVALGAGQVGTAITSTGTYIKRIFTGKEDGKALGGVLRIAAITGKVAVDASSQEEVSIGERLSDTGLSLISLMAMLSIGLGIANLMPIPMLDGGHLVYYVYEAVAGRPLSQKAQEIGFRIGLAVLLGLFVILTINDVGYIRSLFS